MSRQDVRNAQLKQMTERFVQRRDQSLLQTLLPQPWQLPPWLWPPLRRPPQPGPLRVAIFCLSPVR